MYQLRRLSPFLICAACCWVVGYSFHLKPASTSDLERTDSEIQPRKIPLAVIRNDTRLASMAPRQLNELCQWLQPYWETHRASDILHALRLWGPAAVFPPEAPFSVPAKVAPMQGQEMMAFFLHQKTFQKFFLSPEAFFFRSPRGIGHRTAPRDPSALAHYDDFVALAAELSLPSDTSFFSKKEHFTIKDMLRHALYYFTESGEIEFSAVAFAAYLPRGQNWRNRFGQEFDFDRLAELLITRDLKTCACYGTHVPYALSVFLVADDQEKIVSQAARLRILSRLAGFSKALQTFQGAAGWWDRRWCKECFTMPRIEEEEVEWVRSTGHHLEWLALAPPEVRPPASIVQKAVSFISNSLKRSPRFYLSQAVFFNPYSHAGRAVLLWSGYRFGAEILPKSPGKVPVDFTTRKKSA